MSGNVQRLLTNYSDIKPAEKVILQLHFAKKVNVAIAKPMFSEAHMKRTQLNKL